MPREHLSSADIQVALDDLAQQMSCLVIDGALENVAIVGIRRGGAHLAQRLATQVRAKTGFDIPLGLLDITLYRDDVLVGLDNPLPVLRGTDIPFSLEQRPVILVDDVLFTGRTVRAALGALLDVGRPSRVWLCVLVDRGLRELPIQADFVGRTCDATQQERVSVELTEEGHDTDRVIVVLRGNP